MAPAEASASREPTTPRRTHEFTHVLHNLEKREAELHEQLEQLRLENAAARLRHDLLTQLSVVARVALDVVGQLLAPHGKGLGCAMREKHSSAISSIESCIRNLLKEKQAVIRIPQANESAPLRLPSSADAPLAESLVDGGCLSLLQHCLRMVQASPHLYFWLLGCTYDTRAASVHMYQCLLIRLLQRASVPPAPVSPSGSGTQRPAALPPSSPTPAASTHSNPSPVPPDSPCGSTVHTSSVAEALQCAKLEPGGAAPWSTAGALAVVCMSRVMHEMVFIGTAAAKKSAQASPQQAQDAPDQAVEQQQAPEQQQQAEQVMEDQAAAAATAAELEALLDVWVQLLEEDMATSSSSSSGRSSRPESASGVASSTCHVGGLQLQQAAAAAVQLQQQQDQLQGSEKALVDTVLAMFSMFALQYVLQPAAVQRNTVRLVQQLSGEHYMSITEQLQLSAQQLHNILAAAGLYEDLRSPFEQRRMLLQQQLDQLSDSSPGSSCRAADAAPATAGAAAGASEQVVEEDHAAAGGSQTAALPAPHQALGQGGSGGQDHHQEMLQLCDELEHISRVLGWYLCAQCCHVMGLLSARQAAVIMHMEMPPVCYSKWLLAQLHSGQPWLLAALQEQPGPQQQEPMQQPMQRAQQEQQRQQLLANCAQAAAGMPMVPAAPGAANHPQGGDAAAPAAPAAPTTSRESDARGPSTAAACDAEAGLLLQELRDQVMQETGLQDPAATDDLLRQLLMQL